MKLSVEMRDDSLEDIKRDYLLREFFLDGSAQLENVAATIQSLYLYAAIISSHQCPKSLEASVCRTAIIMSYSVVEAIVISVGYRIQSRCRNCAHPCQNKCCSMFEGPDAHTNEKNAFWNADHFLKEKHIVEFDNETQQFYKDFRNGRNNIHLARRTIPLDQDSRYTPHNCQVSFNFLRSFIKEIDEKYKKYINDNKCIL